VARRSKPAPEADAPAAPRIIDFQRRADAASKVLTGNATREDAMIFMRDLMLATGFWEVTPSGMSAEQVKFSEGRRSVYRFFADLIGNDEAFLAIEKDARTSLREVQPRTQD
jgi:hypothetical protein